MPRDQVARPADPDRVYAMQRRHRPVRVPPCVAQRVEARDLLGHDARRRPRLTSRPFSLPFAYGGLSVDPPGARLYTAAPTHCASFARLPQGLKEFMPRLVMKFGGTSVADVQRIRNVAAHVKREIDAGAEVAVVVSAMAGKTNELVAWCKEAGSHSDNPEYDSVVASGELVTAGLLALVLKDMGLKARSWAGMADSARHRRRAWLGPHRRHRRSAAYRGLRGGRDRRRRRLSGRAQGHQPRDDARARRLGHVRRRARGGDLGRPLRHLYRRRRRLHVRPARRAEGAPARQGGVRGNAGNGLARRQGAAGALGRTGDGQQGQALRALVVRRSRAPEAWHAHLRRGGNHGAGGRHRHRLLARRSADHACAMSRTSRASRRRSSCRWPTPTSTST